MLEAAKAVFVERGYAGATLAEVIGRSGGSRATLYKQFGGKEGLFAAIIGEICAGMVALLDDSAAVSDPEHVLLAFGRGYMAGLMEPAGLALYRTLVGEADRFPELAEAVYRSGPLVAADRLSTLLRRWRAENRLRIPHPELAARQFLEIVKGDLHFRALLRVGLTPTRSEIDECVQSAVRLFLAGSELR